MLKAQVVSRKLKVKLTQELAPLRAELQAEVSHFWKREVASFPKRFDGQILFFDHIDGPVLFANAGKYSTYLAQLKSKEISEHLNLWALGVSGVILLEDQVLIGRRASDVSFQGGLWELAPSGSLTAEFKNPDGSIDFEKQLMIELEEELGIRAESVLKREPFALVPDPSTRTIDIGIRISLKGIADEYQNLIDSRQSKEYSSVKWVKTSDVHPLIEVSRTLLKGMTDGKI